MVTLLNYRARGGCFENMRTNISQFHVQEICAMLGPPREFKPLPYKQSAANVVAQHETATMLISFKGDAVVASPFLKSRLAQSEECLGEHFDLHRSITCDEEALKRTRGNIVIRAEHARLRGSIINVKLAGSFNCTRGVGGWCRNPLLFPLVFLFCSIV